MKKTYLLIALAAMMMVSCQPKNVPVDIDAEKAAITEMFDNFMAAYSAGDAAILGSFLTDDALFVTTDPSEFWNKEQFTDLWAQTFNDGVPELNSIGEMEIRVAPDGKSATAVHQYEMPLMIPGIPMRNAYHLVKTDDGWKIFFGNAALIPYNEDLPKLLEALQ
jgi:ketosteroid isomerase-like protein